MKLCCFSSDEESDPGAAGPVKNPNRPIKSGQPVELPGGQNRNASVALKTEKNTASHNPKSDQTDQSTTISAESAAGQSKSQTQQNESISISEDIWDKAYEGVRKDNRKLVENYEEIVEYEIRRQDASQAAGRTSITAPAETALSETDRKLRRQQMKDLVKSRTEKAEGRNSAKKIATGTVQVVQKFMEQIGSALITYPPAGLAWAGVTFLFERALVSVEASIANIEGLGYVTGRLDFYMGLCTLLLRRSWQGQGVGERIRDCVVDLYKSLLDYQMKSVCAYYRFHRIMTFLKDQVQLNDWKGQVTDIKAAEFALFEDVDLHDKLVSMQLKEKHAESTMEIAQLTRQLLEFELQKEEQRHGDRIRSMLYAADATYNASVWAGVDVINECLPKTRVKILEDIMNWVKSEDKERMILLDGMAGTGKSTIARTISRRCYEQGLLGASFFFSSYHGSNIRDATRFVSTIAIQLSKKSGRLKRFIGEALEVDENICSQFIRDQWTKLIVQPLKKLAAESCSGPWILVVDAMDECQRENDVSIILTLFSEAACDKGFPLKIIVTGRPQIRGAFNTIPDESRRVFVVDAFNKVNKSTLNKDIRELFRHQFSEIRKSSAELQSGWPGEKKIDRLVCTAAGSFIYAATVCRFILQHTDHYSGDALLRKVLPDEDDMNSTIQPLKHRDSDLPHASPFVELDKMYMRIIHHSIATLVDEKDRISIAGSFKRIAGSVTLLCDPLSAIELSSLLDVPKEKVDRRLKGLCSVLYVPEDDQSPVRLLHASFRDFLLDPERCVDRLFQVDEKEGHRILAEGSIALMMANLKEDMCQLGDPGILASEIENGRVSKHISRELQYACRYWAKHAQLSGNLCDYNKIYDFLQKHLLHWFEAQSLNGHLPECILGILGLKLNISPDVSPLIYALLHDAWRFLLNQRSTIEEAPLQVYHSALVFAPRSSIIRQLDHAPIPTWLQITPEIEDKWGPSLQTLHHPSGDTSRATSVAFSPSGEIIACAYSNTISLWDSTSGASRGLLMAERPQNIVFSPNGQLIAAYGYTHSARIWDVTSMALRDVIGDHNDWITAMSFSFDSLYLATGSKDSNVRIFDITERKCSILLMGDKEPVVDVVFFSDNQRLASASEDGTVKLWNPFTKELLRTLTSTLGPIHRMILSPGGRLLACGSGDGAVYVWDTSTLVKKWTLKRHSRRVTALAFSEDNLLVSASHDNTLILWDVTTGRYRTILPIPTGILATVVFSRPKASLLASGSIGGGLVRLWNGHTGGSLGVFQGHSSFVSDLKYSTQGLLASASDDGTVRLWNTEAAGSTESDLQYHTDSICQVVFSPDGRVVASAPCDTTVMLWDASTGAFIRTLLCDHGAKKILFSHNSRFLALTSDILWLTWLWDAQTGDLLFKSSDNLVGASCFFTSDDQTFVSISRHSVLTFNVKTRKESKISISIAPRHWYELGTISPESPICACALEDGSITLWHINKSDGPMEEVLILTPRDLKPWAGDNSDSEIWKISISPDCQYLAAAYSDYTIGLWDLKSKVCRRTPRNHSSSIFTLVFSPDSQLLASGSYDKSVRIWDIKALNCVGLLERDGSTPRIICFSPNSEILASWYDDGILGLWNVKKKTCFQTASPGTGLYKLQFSEDSSYLITDHGTVHVALPGNSTVPQGRFSQDILVCGSWVFQNNKRIFRLSSDYDQKHVAVRGSILAIPHMSGRIAFLDFSRALRLDVRTL